MSRLSRAIAAAANTCLEVAGLRLTRLESKWDDLDLYAEKACPERPRYVNIGAGDFFHPLWHNLDTPNEFYSAFQRDGRYIPHDLRSREMLPFESGSIMAVYMSHVIEHLSDAEVIHCLKEVHRCLSSDGVFRVSCPDMDFEYEAFRRGDAAVWRGASPWHTKAESIEQRFLEHFATVLAVDSPGAKGLKASDEEVRSVFSRLSKSEAFEYFISRIPLDSRQRYPENHVNWFNVSKVRTMLEGVGFRSVYESRYGQSRSPYMRNTKLFDVTVPAISLYVEGWK